MGDIRNMNGVGFRAPHAESIVGTVETGATAAGSGQSDAFALTAEATLFTTVASSTGAILPSATPSKSEYRIYNGGDNTLSVYPPTGGQINNESANAAISVAAGKGCTISRLDATHWGATFA